MSGSVLADLLSSCSEPGGETGSRVMRAVPFCPVWGHEYAALCHKRLCCQAGSFTTVSTGHVEVRYGLSAVTGACKLESLHRLLLYRHSK